MDQEVTNQVAHHTLETTAAALGSKATYTGAGVTLTGWALSSEFAALVGMLLAGAGFLTNWYFKWKQDQREQVEHELRVQAILNDKEGGLP